MNESTSSAVRHGANYVTGRKAGNPRRASTLTHGSDAYTLQQSYASRPSLRSVALSPTLAARDPGVSPKPTSPAVGVSNFRSHKVSPRPGPRSPRAGPRSPNRATPDESETYHSFAEGHATTNPFGIAFDKKSSPVKVGTNIRSVADRSVWVTTRKKFKEELAMKTLYANRIVELEDEIEEIQSDYDVLYKETWFLKEKLDAGEHVVDEPYMRVVGDSDILQKAHDAYRKITERLTVRAKNMLETNNKLQDQIQLVKEKLPDSETYKQKEAKYKQMQSENEKIELEIEDYKKRIKNIKQELAVTGNGKVSINTDPEYTTRMQQESNDEEQMLIDSYIRSRSPRYKPEKRLKDPKVEETPARGDGVSKANLGIVKETAMLKRNILKMEKEKRSWMSEKLTLTNKIDSQRNELKLKQKQTVSRPSKR